ncbi:MAG: Arylsulfatase [Acidobacteriota bacterium]
MRHISILNRLLIPLLLLTGSLSPVARPIARPNIVFILADDLGWADLGSYGADLHETPHLDRLARQGVRFTQAYAMSVCSPTRSAILTGKHAARLNFTIWREGSVGRDGEAIRSKNRLIPPATIHNLGSDETTIAELLRDSGYLTFHVGKWHLGDAANSPESQGFDLNLGGTHLGAPATFFWPFRGAFGQSREFRYVPGLGIGKEGQYLTDRFTDEALRLIDEAAGRPFFLNLWYHNPHTPIEGKPELTTKYQQRLKPGLNHQNADYAAMIETLDENVGRLMAHLEKNGLAARTLFVFTSDNGGYVNQYKGRQVTSNAPLRSGKGSLYEGGVRVPLIASWPGVAVRGAVIDQPVISMDLFRTFAEAAGVKGETGVDGLSLLPLLRNPQTRLERESLYFHYPHYYPTTSPVSAVREGDWKLLEYFEDLHIELYHLREDPGEKNDLAGSQPAQASRLRTRLHEWRRAVNAQLPSVNPNAQP